MIIENDYERFVRKERKKDIKYKLVKVATTGLIAIGIAVSVALSSKTDKTDFKYDHTIEETFDKSFSEQLEEYSKVNLSNDMEQILNPLALYVHAKDEYDQISMLKGVDEEKLANARKQYVSSVSILCKVGYAMLEEKASSGISPTAIARIDSHYNSSDGPSYDIHIYDNGREYDVKNLPVVYSKLLNLMDEVSLYRGDGTSKAWAEQMNAYDNLAEKIYANLISISTDDVKLKYHESIKTR